MFHEGIELCEKNAKRLIEEADNTFRIGAHTAAFFLGYVAWEELGKAFLFLEYWEKDEISFNTWKNEFKDHIGKIHLAKQLTETYMSMASVLHPGASVLIDQEYSNRAFNIRNASLFVNYNFNTKKWESPIEVSTKLRSWAAKMITSAKSAMDVLQRVKQDRGL